MKEIFSISRIGFGHEEPSSSDSSPRSGPRRSPLQLLLRAPRLSLRFFRFLVVGNNDAIRVMDEEEQVRRRRFAQTTGGVVLFVLGVAMTVGWRQRARVVRWQHVTALVERSQYATDQARFLSPVDLPRARAVLNEQVFLVEEALAHELDEQRRSALFSTLTKLRETVDEVSHIHRVTPSDYLDLSLVRDETTGSVMDAAGDTLFVLDREDGVVLSVSTVTRAGSVVGGAQDLAGARSFAVAPDAAEATFDVVYVLTDDVVVAVDERGGSPRRIVGSDDPWQDARFIAVYGGNVYVLDQGVSELYKYAKEADAFGQRQRWLAPGITADFSKVLDLAIDGRVWMLERDGTVAQFDRGSRTSFRTQPIDELIEPVAFSVPIPGTRIWMLDRAGKRVVAFDRENGAYAGQWESDVFADAVDIAVSQQRETLFVLTRDAIKTVSLAEEP